jgi:hypothetical protein
MAREKDGGQHFEAHVAQSVEHFLGKEEVMGSIPVVGSILEARSRLLAIASSLRVVHETTRTGNGRSNSADRQHRT